MRRFFVVFAFFAALIFVVSCGETEKNIYEYPDSSNQTGEKNDSDKDQGAKQGELDGECYPNETCNKGLVCDIENNICIKNTDPQDDESDADSSSKPDDDSGESVNDDDADTAPDQQDDDADSTSEPIPDDDTDTEEPVTDDDVDTAEPDEDKEGDDADSAAEENDDDTDSGIIEPTEAAKCADAGGNWNEAESTCTKTAECSGLPENAQWNGDSSYTMTYTDGDWSDEIEAEYNKETAGTCHYKCADGYLWNNSECANPCPAGYFWTGSTCVDPCEPNPCNISNSTGVCTATDVTTYSCDCEENYFWTGSECVSPCDPNPCNYTGSTGVCSATDATTYSCDCEEYYFWTGSECVDPCPTGYFWSGTECVNPCDPNPCNYTGSTGFCTATGTTTYTCACEENYFWTGSTCVSPCDPNPCAGIEHSTGCTATDLTRYYCECNESYALIDSECTLLSECSTTNTGPCYDSTSRLAWSKKADTTYTWSSAGTYCDSLGSGWRLPNISELRTLIQNCSGTVPGGSCAVDSDHLAPSYYSSDNCVCGENSSGKYSKFGEICELWSSSESTRDGYAWGVYFEKGYVNEYEKNDSLDVKCVYSTTAVSLCDSDPCAGIEHSDGICHTTTWWNVYTCGCEENYLWNGSECVNPCDPNPCAGKEHSTGACQATGTTTYNCGCENNYFWTGSECVNPCDPNPCAGIEHSNGTCTGTGTTTYNCGCDTNYFWSGSQCVNPCDPNPCLSIQYATGVCRASSSDRYKCECKTWYVWRESILTGGGSCS